MLIAEGGGGTAWNSMSMDDMQRLIQNPDIEKHYDLVGGWQKSAELVNSHLLEVRSYRDNLAAAWPPKKSAASAAYLERLDELIDHLTETYKAALANHDALAAATLSLSLAQHDVQKLYDEYRANETLLQRFEAKKQQAAAPTPHPTPAPSGDEPPVAPGRQEELRQQAAVLLGGVSTDLAQAQLSLVRPRPYEPANKIEEEQRPNDGSMFTAPPLPPVTSAAISERPTQQSTRASLTFLTPGSPQLAATGPGVPPSTGTSQPGLVLGEAKAPVGTPPPTVPSVAQTLPVGTSPITAPALAPPGGTNFFTGPGATPPGPGTFPPGQGPLPGDGVVRPSSGVAPMPPGGIIGAAPGAGPDKRETNRTGLRRVNPIGGVIGEGSQGTTGSHAINSPGSSGFTGAYGQPVGRRSNRSGEIKGSPWDPDNPWQIAEGVDPVVLPTREQRVDPGPAIGLN